MDIDNWICGNNRIVIHSHERGQRDDTGWNSGFGYGTIISDDPTHPELVTGTGTGDSAGAGLECNSGYGKGNSLGCGSFRGDGHGCDQR